MLTNRKKSLSVSKAKAEEETVGKQIVIFLASRGCIRYHKNKDGSEGSEYYSKK